MPALVQGAALATTSFRPAVLCPLSVSARSAAFGIWSSKRVPVLTARSPTFSLKSLSRHGRLACRCAGSSFGPAFGLAVGAVAGSLRRRRSVAGCRSAHSSRSQSAAANGASFLSESVVKPANDDREYRVVQLANGLRACLVSDSSADVASAAVTVRAGCFQDPDDLPGLAHFHEHMLFLGTELYPEEGGYNRFLNKHGGDSNAFTASEFTTYYFKVAAPHFADALHRFAQFFIAPTFDLSCLERERKAVDSESTNYSMEDSWRMLQVVKTTCSEGHPFRRFDVGNLQTLVPATQSKIVSWHKDHYQAGAMTLAVVGRESLEELEQVVLRCFGPVRGGSGRPQGPYAAPCWPIEQLGRVVSCVPVKDARSISVGWPLPPQSAHLFGKPELYISHVLGHEGRGSLHDILNQRGWVHQLHAGPSQSFSDVMMLSLNIVLTPEGDAHRREVLDLLFEYVAMARLAGPKESTFHELAALQEIAFAHKEESPAPDDFMAGVALGLHHYSPKEVLRGPFAVDDWEPGVLQEYLDCLQPERCIVFLASPAFAAEAEVDSSGWQREKWYRALFKQEHISEGRLQRWRRGAGASIAGVEASPLMLPRPNIFVPQDFSLRWTGKPSGSRLPTEAIPPTLLEAGPPLRLWHKLDSTFGTPRAYALTQVHMLAYDAGPEMVVMLRSFCNMVADDLNTFAYDASVAGLTYGVEFADSLSFSAGGFSHMLPELFRVVAGRVGELLAEIEFVGDGTGCERGRELREKLHTQQQIILQDYRNLPKEEPWYLCGYYTSFLMLRGTWHLREYEEVLERAPSLPALAAGVRSAFSRVQSEMLVHGNLTTEEAREFAKIWQGTLTALGAGRLDEVEHRSVTQLRAGSSVVWQMDATLGNPEQENSCTQNTYQVGPLFEDIKRDACLGVVCHIGGTSAYQKLRTEEQLGYMVSAGAWSQQHVCGFAIIVQGNAMHPSDVDVRIEAWLNHFEQELAEMSEREFTNHIQAVISERTQRYSLLPQETLRHWAEIQPRLYRFDRISEGARALGEISKNDVVQFFREYIAATGAKRRKFSARVLGGSAAVLDSKGLREGEELLESVEDIRRFQSDVGSFPALLSGEVSLVDHAVSF